MEPDNDKNAEPLASEIYKDLKESIRFKNRTIIALSCIIVILVVAMTATNIYHIYQWSQFDTVVVESSDGTGNANYVRGDNSGGIYIDGEGGSTQQEGREIQGHKDQAQDQAKY